MTAPLASLDPRTKLLLQVGFVTAAYAYTEPRPLLILTAGVVVLLHLCGQSVGRMLREFRGVLAFLALAPVIAAVALVPPAVVPADGWVSALAAYRVLLVVFVSVAIARVTPPREAEAAIRWFVPGRPGRALAVGVGLVFRFMPVIRTEARGTRRALTVRGAEERPLHRRIELLGIVTFVRLLRRADRVSRALRVRCLAWNATVPSLEFRRADVPALGVAMVLLGLAVAGIGI